MKGSLIFHNCSTCKD